MIKYLLPEQLKTNLSLGKAVEQWLGYKDQDDYVVLKWVSIQKERNGDYTIMYIENFDDGNEDFLDIYAFSYIDPDEPAVINSCKSAEDVLVFALNTYGASFDKYVAQGMIQNEYANYLKSK
jgi:hypothetical protein